MDESEGQVVNFERICRLCLHEKRTLTDIFEPTSDNNNYSIDQKIMACATIDLSKGDGLPSRICVKCLTSVNAAFDFRVQCENADKTLHILHDLLNSETDKIKPGKDVSATESTVEEIEETEKVIDKVSQLCGFWVHFS
ncbi:UNVERIFIED_CONTAM: hypothetical protein PYX00_003140 [Menopon gallinae]|uniref:ZAD domain-containing protein n=1 Tax=Menopon gallinae TaxID=328185 RepID=A0AAW2I099_9NEOP